MSSGNEVIVEVSRCAYIVPRKKRACRMTVKSGHRFCGEHALLVKPSSVERDQTSNTASTRIVCPLDSNHTVETSRLTSHLKKCPAKRLQEASKNQDYVAIDYNLRRQPEHSIIGLTLKTTSDDNLLSIIGRLESLEFAPLTSHVPSTAEIHRVLKDEFEDTRNGPAVLKHLEQNSSLITLIEDRGLLKNSAVVVEFGSGRGRLTYWLTRVDKVPEHDFVLVDKASHRHKFDNKLKDESVSIQRIRVDIKDVVLSQLPQVRSSSKNIVGVSKHLCGAATDLALMSLEDIGKRLEGFVIALCCHHRCSWNTFCDRRFLIDHGFKDEEFSLLCSITSWATCGTGRPRDFSVSHENKDEGGKSRYECLNLPLQHRQLLGRKAKRLLNEARLNFVAKAFPHANVELVVYCDANVSIENVAIVANRKN